MEQYTQNNNYNNWSFRFSIYLEIFRSKIKIKVRAKKS